MKALKLTFIFILFSSIFISAQGTYHWIGATTGIWHDAGNWEEEISLLNQVPSNIDIVIFDNGTDLNISLDWQFASEVSELYISPDGLSSPTTVSFNEPMGEYANLIISSYMKLEAECSLNLSSTGLAISVNNYGGVDIFGTVIIGNGAHKLTTSASTEFITFYEGATFISDNGLTDYPFGDTGMGMPSVIFDNGSNYLYYDGLAPFGSGVSGNIAFFHPESNFKIMAGDGSNIIFSEKTYGNIINESGNDIIVQSTVTGNFPFAFNSMTTLNGAITFNGTSLDLIEIYGNLINAQNSVISLQSGMFNFTNPDTYIEGSLVVKFYIDGLNAAFNMLPAGNKLTLNNNIEIISSSGSSHDVSIIGTLDCQQSTIILNDVFLHLLDPATFITSHPNGFSGSVPFNISYTFLTTFEYNGSVVQGTGFASHYTGPLGKIIINNTSGVEMDNNMSINTLELNGGFFIKEWKLKMTDIINYLGGNLIGNQSESVLEVASNHIGDFVINTNLLLDSLIINSGANTEVRLVDAGNLFVNDYYHIFGQFLIDSGVLGINKSFTFNPGSGTFNGGKNAGLIFNSTFIPTDPIPNFLELASYKYHAPYALTTLGEITVWELMELTNGELIFSDQTLNLYGNYISSGGVLGASGASILNLLQGTVTSNQINLVFNETVSRNSLESLTLNRLDLTANISSNLNITNSLNLLAGKLKISDYNIRLDPIVTVSGGNTDSYIITGLNGKVSSNLATGIAFNFPIGTPDYYTPVTITPPASGEFTIHVANNVLSNGVFGEPLVNSYDDLVNLTWNVNTTITNYNMDLSWPDIVQGSTYLTGIPLLFNYDENTLEWINTNAAINDHASGFISTGNVSSGGLFMISSHVNDAPTGEDGEVIADLNIDYLFTENDFIFADLNGDQFIKMMITQNVTDGVLYIDYDDNGSSSSDELLFLNSEIMYSDILSAKLKYHPNNEGSYNFGFKVSDGLNYSSANYTMTIIVGTNNAPSANDQDFLIAEHSQNGTEVGQLQATGSIGETLIFEVLDHTNRDAFNISSDGFITVTNSELLEYTLSPSFQYPIKVYNSSSIDLFTEFILLINLEEIITGELSATNYISPNGDGVNDTWVILNRNEDNLYNVAVFDKQGHKVFGSDNYQDIWNGTNNGTRLNPGVYYYIIRSGDVNKKGTITLIR